MRPNGPVAPRFLLLAGALVAIAALMAAGGAAGEVEPNDDEATAEPMALYESHSGTVNTSDRDVYIMNVSEPGLLTLHVAGSDLEVYVLRLGDGLSMGSQPLPAGSGAFTIGVVADVPQAYYVSIWSYSTQRLNYTVDASMMSSFAPIEGTSEVEPNNYPATANDLPVGWTVTGRTDAQFSFDSDYWIITGLGEGLFELRAQLTYSEVWLLYPGNLSFVSVMQTQAAGVSTYRAVLPAEVDALLVQVRSERSLNYTLDVEFEAGLGRIQGLDEVEPNDRPQNASAAPLDGAVFGRVSLDFQDTDYWSLEVGVPGALLMEFNTTLLRIDFLQAWDGGYAPVGAAYGMGVVTYGLAAEANSTYLIRVTTTSQAPDIDYRIAVTFDPTFGPLDGGTEVEPNGRPESATPLALGQPQSGKLAQLFADADWWSAGIAGSGLVTVNLTDCCAQDYRATVYRNGSDAVLYSLGACGAFCPKVLNFAWEGEGTLLVRIWTARHEDVSYGLRVDFELGFNSTAGPDEVEPNNNRTAAQPIEAGTWVRAKLNTGRGDLDFFQVFAPNATVLAVPLESDQADDIGVYLDLPYRVLTRGQSPSHGTVLYASVPAGDLVLRFSLNGAVADYTFEVLFFDSVSQLFAVPGEVEPNDDPMSPVSLAAGSSTRGAVGWPGDGLDYFAVQGVAGDLLEIAVDVEEGGPLDLSFPALESFAGRFWRPSAGFADWPVRLVFQAPGALVFAARSASPTVYSVHVNVTDLHLYSDGRTTLEALNETPPVGLRVEPFAAWQPDALDIHVHDRMLYDKPVCIRHSLFASLSHVDLPVGQLFTTEDGQTYVAAGDPGLSLWAVNATCVPSFAYTPSVWGKAIGTMRMAGVAPPGVQDLLTEIAHRQAWGVSGLMALWAVTAGVSDADLERWQATYSDAIDANDILAAAGLEERVPVPDQPSGANPTGSGGGSAGTGGSGWSLGGMVAAGLVGGGVAFLVATPFVRRSRRPGRRAPPAYPPPFPSDLAAGLAVPGVPPGAATGARSPSTPGVSSGPRPGSPAGALGAPGRPSGRLHPPPGAHPGAPACRRCGAACRPGYGACPSCGLPYEAR